MGQNGGNELTVKWSRWEDNSFTGQRLLLSEPCMGCRWAALKENKDRITASLSHLVSIFLSGHAMLLKSNFHWMSVGARNESTLENHNFLLPYSPARTLLNDCRIGAVICLFPFLFLCELPYFVYSIGITIWRWTPIFLENMLLQWSTTLRSPLFVLIVPPQVKATRAEYIANFLCSFSSPPPPYLLRITTTSLLSLSSAAPFYSYFWCRFFHLTTQHQWTMEPTPLSPTAPWK